MDQRGGVRVELGKKSWRIFPEIEGFAGLDVLRIDHQRIPQASWAELQRCVTTRDQEPI